MKYHRDSTRNVNLYIILIIKIFSICPNNAMQALVIRPCKLNSQFIVTAHMDFQTFSKKFRFHIVYSNLLWPCPLERCN